MKALICFSLTLMVLLPFGLMAQSPVGNWKMSVPDENGKLTPMKVDILADGSYNIDFGAEGSIEIKGKYTVDGAKMTIQDTEGSDCPEKGVYTFKVEGDTLTLTRMSDGCADRGGPDGVMTMQRG
jgi:hypothetical protein